MKVWAPPSSYAAKGGRDGGGTMWPSLVAEVAGLTSLAQAQEWRERFICERQRDTPEPFLEPLWDSFDARCDEIRVEMKVRQMDRAYAERVSRDD